MSNEIKRVERPVSNEWLDRVDERMDMEWQPIDTAPKNGSVIDLWLGGEFPGRRTDCYWGKPSHSCGEMEGFCDDGAHWMEDAWIDQTFNSSIEDLPTHWMPQPEPPAI